LIPAPREPVNGQARDTVDIARGEVNKGMLVSRPLGAWHPRRSYVFVAINDDAHIVVPDMVNQFEVLPVRGFPNDLDCFVRENDSLGLGSAE
jgi:hypothetical protein